MTSFTKWMGSIDDFPNIDVSIFIEATTLLIPQLRRLQIVLSQECRFLSAGRTQTNTTIVLKRSVETVMQAYRALYSLKKMHEWFSVMLNPV